MPEGENPERDTVVVDVETTGLDSTCPDHFVVEAAWWNLATGESSTFVPVHNVGQAMTLGDPEALRINRYEERLLHAQQDVSGAETFRMFSQLEGSALAAANPAFDSAFLLKMFRAEVSPLPLLPVRSTTPWHFRMPDLASYAAGVLGLPLGALPGLSDVCRMLDIELLAAHTAAADVHAAGQCFLELIARAEQRREREAARAVGVFSLLRTPARVHR